MGQTINIITEIQTKPRPRASRRGKFIQVYTPKTALTYERYIASEYQRLGGKYYEDKPIVLDIGFLFKVPKSTPRYKQDAIKIWELTDKSNKFVVPCTIHKDVDNLAKSILDALNTIAFDDDKQVVILRVWKQWTTKQEQVVIRTQELEYLQDKELKKEVKLWKLN